MTVNAVLLDVTGTILDEASEHEALDRTMGQVSERFRLDATGADLSGEFSLALMEIMRAEGGDTDEAPADFVPYERAAKEVFAALLEFRGFTTSPEDTAWFWDAYLGELKRAWRPYPEVPHVLNALRERGVRVVLVTDGDRMLTKEMIPRLRMDDVVDGLVCAEDVGYVKPHPALFERAVSAAGVDAAACLMVGDSYERDILGARAAGVKRAVLVDRHRARTVDVPTIASLKRLPRLLGELAEAP